QQYRTGRNVCSYGNKRRIGVKEIQKLIDCVCIGREIIEENFSGNFFALESIANDRNTDLRNAKFRVPHVGQYKLNLAKFPAAAAKPDYADDCQQRKGECDRDENSGWPKARMLR